MTTAKLKPGVVATMAVSAMIPDPNQPRRTFNDERLKALAESLKLRQEDPVKVRQDGKRTIIVDGERRWRAAKLAKLKTLNVLLDDRQDQMDIAATQITTAVQREELQALDIAEFLVDLQKREKATANQLLAALAQRGIKEIGPAKIDRIMRLVELPEWAKRHMRSGVFNERHGQALLPAVKFPEVMKHARESIERELQWKGGLTAKEIDQDVEQAFRAAGTDLNQRYGDEKDIRAFPIDVCLKCEWYKKLAGREFCLNRKLFDKKQSEALLLKAQKEAEKAERAAKKGQAAPSDDANETDPTKVTPRKVKVNESNIVALKRLNYSTYRALDDARFDKGQCQTCPHRHKASVDGGEELAEDHCFHPPCFDVKRAQDGRLESRRGKMREYLEAWLRPIVMREAAKRLTPNQQTGVMLWLATGAVDHCTAWYGGQMHDKAARATVDYLRRHGLKDLPSLMEFATDRWSPAHLAALVSQAVSVMTREQLRWFAHYIQIELDDPAFAYRVDDGYLKLRRKAELQQLWMDSGCEASIANLGTEELRQWCLESVAREKIGVPADLLALYREPFDARGEVDVDLDDEDAEGTVCIGCGCTHMDPCEEGCSWVVQDQLNSFHAKGGPMDVGLCSSPECTAKHMDRWRKGDKTLSPEARERVAMRRAMLTGRDDEVGQALAGAAAELDEAPKAKRKRA